MCENEQKPELEPEPRKIRAPELEPCSWKEALRSRSCVIFTTAPQPWNIPQWSRAHRRKIQQKNCLSNNLQQLSK